MTLSPEDHLRIEGRKWADEMIQFASEQGSDFFTGFSRAIKQYFNEILTPTGAMTEEEAKEFESQTISFGKYFGERWDEVRKDYIEWLADSSIPLQKYVKSDRFKRRED